MRQDQPSIGKTVLSFALIYLAADVALNRFAFSDGWTIVWPLNGITIEGLRAANDHFGDTTQIRLMRLMGSGDQQR
jgi:hypothetical protein